MLLKLIEKFIFDEESYFRELLKNECNKVVENVLNEIGKLHELIVLYYKNERGNLYTECYLDGEKVSFNSLNAFLKNKVYKFENETKILFK